MSQEINTAIEAILKEAGISPRCTYIGQRKRDEWDCDSWVFTFIVTSGIRCASVEFEYFTGLGHRVKPKKSWDKTAKPVAPNVAGLIYSLLMDSSACDMSFNEWCSELGYETDSRKALDIYTQCQESGDKLKKLFKRDHLSQLQIILQDY